MVAVAEAASRVKRWPPRSWTVTAAGRRGQSVGRGWTFCQLEELRSRFQASLNPNLTFAPLLVSDQLSVDSLLRGTPAPLPVRPAAIAAAEAMDSIDLGTDTGESDERSQRLANALEGPPHRRAHSTGRGWTKQRILDVRLDVHYSSRNRGSQAASTQEALPWSPSQ
eukprot:TRINITY_DN48699_c0_g1_i1.p2 TRINITY_DN48699_c0_g1~~TRINITY_DN48699_c0_g1_i1.p2  ORF type:complete len:193 (+),score=22.75 TRINITY_DN48699_c0_g1_i1:81-581(+)